jgi:hypothetical protein
MPLQFKNEYISLFFPLSPSFFFLLLSLFYFIYYSVIRNAIRTRSVFCPQTKTLVLCLCVPRKRHHQAFSLLLSASTIPPKKKAFHKFFAINSNAQAGQNIRIDSQILDGQPTAALCRDRR